MWCTLRCLSHRHLDAARSQKQGRGQGPEQCERATPGLVELVLGTNPCLAMLCGWEG